MPLFKRKQTPQNADAETLAQLQKAGADLSNSRNVRHYLYGPDAAAMADALDRLQAAGFTTTSQPAATGGNWLLLAERQEVVNAATVAEARQLFEGLARSIPEGEYDGWEAALVEKRR